MAKTNDTLLFLSLGLKSKKIVLTDKDFAALIWTVKLDIDITPLKEVVIKPIYIKPNLGNIQRIIDTEYFEPINLGDHS